MKNIKIGKVYGLRWADGKVHCERCGGYMKVSCGTWFCPNGDD